ncbi:hypothetical protein V8F06_004113 [Rhypophila decipiens]
MRTDRQTYLVYTIGLDYLRVWQRAAGQGIHVYLWRGSCLLCCFLLLLFFGFSSFSFFPFFYFLMSLGGFCLLVV